MQNNNIINNNIINEIIVKNDDIININGCPEEENFLNISLLVRLQEKREELQKKIEKLKIVEQKIDLELKKLKNQLRFLVKIRLLIKNNNKLKQIKK